MPCRTARSILWCDQNSEDENFATDGDRWRSSNCPQRAEASLAAAPRAGGGAHYFGRVSFPKANSRLCFSFPFPVSRYPPYVPTRNKNDGKYFIKSINNPEGLVDSRKLGVIHIDELPRRLVVSSSWGFGALPPLMLSVDASL